MDFLKTALASFLALSVAYLIWLRHVNERSEIFKKQVELYADVWGWTGALTLYVQFYRVALEAGKLHDAIDLLLNIKRIQQHFENLSLRDCVFFEPKIWNCVELIAVDCQRLKTTLTGEQAHSLCSRIIANSQYAHIVIGCRLRSTWKIRYYCLYVVWSLISFLRECKISDSRIERILDDLDRRIQSKLMQEFRTIRSPEGIRRLL